jgi:hypothetical protein
VKPELEKLARHRLARAKERALDIVVSEAEINTALRKARTQHRL